MKKQINKLRAEKSVQVENFSDATQILLERLKTLEMENQ